MKVGDIVYFLKDWSNSFKAVLVRGEITHVSPKGKNASVRFTCFDSNNNEKESRISVFKGREINFFLYLEIDKAIESLDDLLLVSQRLRKKEIDKVLDGMGLDYKFKYILHICPEKVKEDFRKYLENEVPQAKVVYWGEEQVEFESIEELKSYLNQKVKRECLN